MVKLKTRKIYFAVFWTLMITSFVFFATILIAFANGYHFNPKTMHLQKTGIIIINGNIKSVDIYLNNNSKSTNLPYKYTGLIPGHYEIKISKNGYQDWEKVVRVEGGKAVTLEDINLFLNDITPINNESNQTTDKILINFLSQNQNLATKNYEIRYNGDLITRFSQNILSGVYDSNSNHFYFQINNKVRVIDFDGANDILLFKLKDNTPITFYVDLPNLYFSQTGQVYQAKIQ